jgi:hypothetical protein
MLLLLHPRVRVCVILRTPDIQSKFVWMIGHCCTLTNSPRGGQQVAVTLCVSLRA